VLFNSEKRRPRLLSACIPVLEDLERRELLSGSTIQTLPFILDFGSDRGEITDKDGQGTGFTRIQANKLGTEYAPSLIDLDTSAGVLRLTTSGSSTTGSNSGTSDNTLQNGLETQFNGTVAGGFMITVRMTGPMSYLNAAYQQGGIYFGPNQDNYVKLTAMSNGSGGVLQFKDEQNGTTTTLPSAAQNFNVGSFSSISTLDLRLVGDAATGKVSAYYALNGSATFTKIPYDLTLSGATKSAFFNTASRAGLEQYTRNNGPAITVTYDSFKIEQNAVVQGSHPTVTSTNPVNGAFGVLRNAFVSADVDLPVSRIDSSTLNANVVLFRTSDLLAIPGVINTTGGGDAIIFQPSSLLDPNTSYTFQVGSGVKDLNGNTFTPYSATFSTGTETGQSPSNISFEKVPLPASTGQTYTSVTIGPDHKLYASTIDGLIQRFSISGDGSLGSAQTITTVQTSNGGSRAITGIAFDPSSTAGNLILWVSHSQGVLTNATDWTGKISKLTGSNLTNYQDVVIGLPRSISDHMNNQLVFGPDGLIYFAQASNTAMGAPDSTWGNRSEHLLNAAILQLDPSKISNFPLNVQTESTPNPYDPFAANAPLKIYASGVRNSFDLVWASNGHLYAPTNGSASGGATPGSPNPAFSNSRIDQGIYGNYTGPVVPGISKITQTEDDWLFDVQNLGYYGHPNPSRYEWVMNGGNPTSGLDDAEVSQYPVGTQPDRNYRGAAFDFGAHYSPNGIIQYSGGAFSGALNGKILVVRYSGGDDIAILTPNADGSISPAMLTGLPGMTGFVDPVDLTEDQSTGFLYVAEYGGQKITLLRPNLGAQVALNKNTFYFNDIQAGSSGGSGSSPAQNLVITNTGTSPVTLPTDAITIGGTNASEFTYTNPGLPITIQPGQSANIPLKFTASTTGVRTATLTVKSNDVSMPTMTINLRGLGTTGVDGNNEPSLQRVLDLFQIPVNVGDTNPADTTFPVPPAAGNDEVTLPRLVKAGDGNVTVELLATFANSRTPVTRFGYYSPGDPSNKGELFYVPGSADAQSVNPQASGLMGFDPGSNAFGIYGVFPAFSNREVYSEDSLNTWEPNAGNRRKVRFYPLKNADGTVVPNAYVFAFEEYTLSYDQNDVIGIIRNVKAAPADAEIGIANADGAPFDNRLVFNRIQNPDTVTPNMVHDKAVLTIRNTGSSALNISSLELSDSSKWTILGGLNSFSIAAGGTQNVTIQFVGSGSGLVQTFDGTLTINSNDSDEPATTVQLAAVWQMYSEASPSGAYAEPTLKQVTQVLGYDISVLFAGETLDHGGLPTRVGEEILSAYWLRADGNAPVSVRLLSALHSQHGSDPNVGVNTSSSLFYFYKGASGTSTKLFQHNQFEGQSLLPHLSGSTTNYAIGTFNPTSTAFGFKVDTRYSDDSLNPLDNNTPGTGHSFRFYAARDQDGNIIPNTYLMAQDYTGLSYSNYDYQDNIYLVSNVRPLSAPSAVTGVNASGSSAGIGLTWAANTEGNVAGYRIYRSSAPGGAYTLLNTTALVTATSYTDILAPAGQTSYYRVTAVDQNGAESSPGSGSAFRPAGSGAPNAASNLQANAISATRIDLSWNDNSSNETGFKIQRSTAGGAFVTIFTAGAGATSFSDMSVSADTTYSYQIVATNSAGDAAPSNTQTLSTPALPGALSSSDIGNPAQTGSTSVINDGSDYDVTGGGLNVWDSSDQFRFVYKQYSGDFDVRVRIAGVSEAATINALVGLMARESLSANAANVFMRTYGQPGGLYKLGVRASTGAATTSAGGSATNSYPNSWVRLQRSGNSFTGYFSTDGVNWTTISTANVAISSTLFVGMAVSSRSAAGTATAQFRSFGDVSTAQPPANPSNLVASVVSQTEIQLMWNDNSSDETGFRIERAVGGGSFVPLVTVGAGITGYSDTTTVAGTTYTYRVIATRNGSDSNPAVSAPVTTPSSTVNFTAVDIGNPSPAGHSTVVSPGTAYDVAGAGANVWDNSDQFHFDYTQVTGDFDFSARIAGVTEAGGVNALVGLMARESLSANSRNVYMRTYGQSGGAYKLGSRSSTGGVTTSVGGAALNSYPNSWVRLTRVGNTFTGYFSTDGVAWTVVSTVTMALPSTVYVGFAVASRTNGSLATAQFRDVSLS
jgi:regulation of enolase protein 1 (concanavalin A-like superfamily)